jgi:predicted branched-subunit amino acid permease
MLNVVKTIANSTPKEIKRAKIIIALLAVVLIITDAYFAFAETRGFPTFSRLFKENQGRLLWFTFLFGCLTGKIFYNRFTPSYKEELNGVLYLAVIVIILSAIGNAGLSDAVPVKVELILFISGVFCAHYFWPQFRRGVKETKPNILAKESSVPKKK